MSKSTVGYTGLHIEYDADVHVSAVLRSHGYYVMTVAEGGKVISLATTCDEDEEGDSSEEENAETVPEKGTEESTTV